MVRNSNNNGIDVFAGNQVFEFFVSLNFYLFASFFIEFVYFIFETLTFYAINITAGYYFNAGDLKKPVH